MHTQLARSLRFVSLGLLGTLTACGSVPGSPPLDAALAPDATVAPRTITLRLTGFATPSDGVRLADGAIVPAGGDVFLIQSRVVSLGAGVGVTLCEVGAFATLAEVPTDAAACASPPARGVAFFSGVGGELAPVGTSLLAWTEDPSARYRMRVIRSANDASVLTLTLEVEPLP